MSLTTRISSDRTFSRRVFIGGRLDTNTAPELESELDKVTQEAISLLIFDLSDLEYISSAGLRVIFKATKTIKAAGGQCGILKMQPQIKKDFDIVKALPDVPIFKDDNEMDDYLDAMQQQALGND